MNRWYRGAQVDGMYAITRCDLDVPLEFKNPAMIIVDSGKL